MTEQKQNYIIVTLSVMLVLLAGILTYVIYTQEGDGIYDKNNDDQASRSDDSSDDGDDEPVDTGDSSAFLFEDLKNAATEQDNVFESNGYTAYANYLGSNSWEYLITGFAPTPCHILTHEAIVAESFPEQVSLELSIQEPGPEEICIQVLEEVNLKGEFSASEQATVSFQVR